MSFIPSVIITGQDNVCVYVYPYIKEKGKTIVIFSALLAWAMTDRNTEILGLTGRFSASGT